MAKSRIWTLLLRYAEDPINPQAESSSLLPEEAGKKFTELKMLMADFSEDFVPKIRKLYFLFLEDLTFLNEGNFFPSKEKKEMFKELLMNIHSLVQTTEHHPDKIYSVAKKLAGFINDVSLSHIITLNRSLRSKTDFVYSLYELMKLSTECSKFVRNIKENFEDKGIHPEAIKNIVRELEQRQLPTEISNVPKPSQLEITNVGIPKKARDARIRMLKLSKLMILES